jgi:hypothetical protein
MAVSPKKRFFAQHAKSSSVVISLAVHGLLFVMALFVVVVSVVPKEEQQFVGQQLEKPGPQLRKIGIPVKFRKTNIHVPAMPRQVSLNHRVKSIAPDILDFPSMSERYAYLGAGTDFSGLGAGPMIDFFGVSDGGEYVIFIVDYSLSMEGEKEGIMRREVARIIRELDRDTKFCVIFFGGPAWSATSKLDSQLDDWVMSSGGGWYSVRPKSWSRLPEIRYMKPSTSFVSRVIKAVETTPLIMGTIYDAPIYMALTMDPVPDTVFFMTDGDCAEERGIDSLYEMVDNMKAAGKKIPVLHTVGFGITLNDQLEEMAELMGGECHYLTARDYIEKYGPRESRRGHRQGRYSEIEIQVVDPDQYPLEFPFQ